MSSPPADRATRLLNRFSEGDRSVSDELLEVIYEELHAIARAQMAAEAPHHTLQPTALVHEAYLKLVRQDGASWASRGHFYALAARVMHTLLVDHARRKGAKKRGGDQLRVTLSGRPEPQRDPETGVDVLDLHEALEELARVDPERARIVEMRFFGGLSNPEVAEVTGIPLRTVERRWRVANAWLRERLDGA